MKYVLLLGRCLFSLVFFLKAIEHFSKPAMEYAVERNAPMPGFLVPFIGVMLFLGSLSILLGFKARLGAWLLIVILTPVTFLMHQFWNTSDVYQCMMEHFCFFKNIALIGALLMMTYFGSGPLSLDRDSQ